jgi:lipoate---protein ligase
LKNIGKSGTITKRKGFLFGDKMKTLDYKKIGLREVSFYLALEEHILSNIDEDVFFLWDIGRSIVCGRNQLIQGEINPDFVREHDVRVYRRPSGGGAIYADEGCFMYSFITKKKDKDEIYTIYLDRLMRLMKDLGVEVYFSGRNDLMLEGKKFSGTSFYQTVNGSVLHGTFLFDTNLEHLVRALSVDEEKIISKGIKSVRERVINVRPFVSMSKEELMDYFIHHLGEKMVELSEEDLQTTRTLEKKYLSEEWMRGQSPKFTYQNKKRFTYGSIEVRLDVRKDLIQSMRIFGDFFEKNNLDDFYPLFEGIVFDQENVLKILEKTPIGEYIYGATNEDFIGLLF